MRDAISRLKHALQLLTTYYLLLTTYYLLLAVPLFTTYYLLLISYYLLLTTYYLLLTTYYLLLTQGWSKPWGWLTRKVCWTSKRQLGTTRRCACICTTHYVATVLYSVNLKFPGHDTVRSCRLSVLLLR